MATSYQLFDGKIVIRLRYNRMCDTTDELIASRIFHDVLKNYIRTLSHQNSRLLGIFPNPHNIVDKDVHLLIAAFRYLLNLPAKIVPQILPGSDYFTKNPILLGDFVEQLYNYWRSLHRLVVCDSIGDRYDKRPYRTFNETVETLMHMVRSAYRDIQENVTGSHPRVYRQVSAGAEIGAIARPVTLHYPSPLYRKLNNISVISQVLIYPPMIFNTPTNKRSGMFVRINQNPLEKLDLQANQWLCYPAKVGDLLILVYFSMAFFELGFSLCNLFELADDEDLRRKPDAIFLFGVPPEGDGSSKEVETIFYDDLDNDLLVATITYRERFGYFGYLKKMILTLHNIKKMKAGRFPYHGAMFHIALRDRIGSTFLIMGDTGAGKSETLEAMRSIIREDVENLVIIADDMGSLEIDQDGSVIGYGTELGAFVRLDDLQSGYAFGQIDRAIIMNPDEVNARVVMPVTKFADVVKGYKVDFVFYANNYDPVDPGHPVIQPLQNTEEALRVFRAGKVMSKGTTTSSGLVQSFYANIFGPPEYPELQENLASRYFNQCFQNGIMVGELRTQLGVPGMERKGPELAARALLDAILSRQ